MSNVKNSSSWTLVQVHKYKLTQSSHVMRSIWSSHTMIIKKINEYDVGKKSHNRLDHCYDVRSLWHHGDIITDRVRSTREGNVFSLFTPGGGGYPSQVQPGGYPDGGTWARSSRGVYPDGVPRWGGTPPQVPPPHQTWLGGYPSRGYLTSGTPPLSDLAGGSTSVGGTPLWIPPPRQIRYNPPGGLFFEETMFIIQVTARVSTFERF